ncbi:hypothetical protein KR038_006350, partial [Drosophila bunnanda]
IHKMSFRYPYFSRQDSVIFKLTNAVCSSYNISWIRINLCRLKAISRHKAVFNMNITFLQPTKDIVVHYRIFKRESGYKPWLLNVKIDGCRFLRKPYNALGIMLFNIYKDFSNINHTCPFFVSFPLVIVAKIITNLVVLSKKGHVFIKDMYLSTDVMKLPLPTGDYLLAIDWIFYGKPQFATNVSYQFVEDLL